VYTSATKVKELARKYTFSTWRKSEDLGARDVPQGTPAAKLATPSWLFGGDPVTARVLCKNCGYAVQFSADGRFLAYQPEATVKRNLNRKYTVRLLEVASGKDRLWLEPSQSVTITRLALLMSSFQGI
jgi:hypothetical protein